MIFEVLAERNRELRRVLEAALEHLVFGSRLVFNQTWEDPEIDQRALAVTPDDTVLTIASAGDNALSLALAGPKKVYAIDLNRAQIHLLKLKIAAAQHLNYGEFAASSSWISLPEALPARSPPFRPVTTSSGSRCFLVAISSPHSI